MQEALLTIMVAMSTIAISTPMWFIVRELRKIKEKIR